jgi:hypothetical protein
MLAYKRKYLDGPANSFFFGGLMSFREGCVDIASAADFKY